MVDEERGDLALNTFQRRRLTQHLRHLLDGTIDDINSSLVVIPATEDFFVRLA